MHLNPSAAEREHLPGSKVNLEFSALRPRVPLASLCGACVAFVALEPVGCGLTLISCLKYHKLSMTELQAVF